MLEFDLEQDYLIRFEVEMQFIRDIYVQLTFRKLIKIYFQVKHNFDSVV